MTTPDEHADRQRVAELLGRAPQGRFDVVVRDPNGDPVVIRNSPLLDDGTPMPTRYWLVAADEIRRIGTLEASGGVNAAEAAVDPVELAGAHRRYAAERDSAIDPGHAGPRPSGGVGGTRVGVKCLHSHWAWHLAGGDDPVGRWIEQQWATDVSPAGADDAQPTSVTIGSVTTVVNHHGRSFELGWGVDNLAERWLNRDDPPKPEDLTNALGAVDDDLDDFDRVHGPITGPITEPVQIAGGPAVAIARLEIGTSDIPTQHTVTRPDLEEVFRIAATESEAQRRDNPGLSGDDARIVLPALLIALSVARRYRLAEVRVGELR